MQTKISLVLSSSLQLKTCSKTRKRSCQIFQTNINRVNTLIKAFILLTVTKPPAKEKYNHADGDHSTAKQPSRLPASREDPGAPSQQWLDPRNLGSAPAGPALGLQNRKPRRRTAQPPRLPQTQSQCHGRRSGDRHVYPSPPPKARPERHAPASKKKKTSVLAGSRASRSPAEMEHHPQESWEFTCGGGARLEGGACARGRSVLTRGREGGRGPGDLLIAGVTGQTGPWLAGVRACSARVGRPKAAVAGCPCARRFGSAVTTWWVLARGGGGPAGL